MTTSTRTLDTSSLRGSVQADRLVLFSPAKLNLFFRVLRKREDQFHEIASLFQAVDLGDYLHLQKAEEDVLTCTDHRIPTDSSNLVLKAAELFRKKTGIPAFAHFHIEKNIPIEAGLGGGSSNLASTLWGLRCLYAPYLSAKTLKEWASEISSDGPFFFSSGRAYCRGRGEIIEDIPEIQKQSLWIAKPVEGLSTPSVYKSCKPELLPQRDPDEIVNGFVRGNSSYFNDLEVSAFTLLPRLALLKNELLSLGFTEVVMTGSGTAFFCTGEKKVEPKLDGIQFFPVHFIYRTSDEWYKRLPLTSNL
ncbi:MAG: 4-(cytidine 5'-diphospho)-2-C-methyl-D-erythritol kinase [Chlamydiae bacterium]|nr:4-(cytidine 5'-diphospho)-2-C-methyl-D-erythritol kinase [Chlamydiota bacterium]